MIQIDESCKRLSETFVTKIGEFNTSLNSVSQKFEDLTKQYERNVEIVGKTSTEISKLKETLCEKKKRISELETRMDAVKSRFN